MEHEIDISTIIDEFKNEGLPEPSLVLYYQQLNHRILSWNDEIDRNIHALADIIIGFNRKDKGVKPECREPIKMLINTDGGEVGAALYICDVIAASETPIYTIGTSKCYSAGGMILMAGHKRFIFDNTTFLLHDGYNSYESSSGKFSDMNHFIEKREERIKEFVLAHTNITSKQYDDNYRRDWFMMSDDIIKYGIADKVVKELDEIL